MLEKIAAYLQYCYPQHVLTTLAGKLADCQSPRIKNLLIDSFIRAYQVDMSIAAQPDPHAYTSFNAFFTRRLQPGIRPIVAAPQIASPADGMISQLGEIQNNLLFQAKNFYYDLNALLAGDKELVPQFIDGSFATIYLAPHNYHRVHMPLKGKLLKTIFVPGSLFSVNNTTATTIPKLFTRNERLICLFETAAGPMALIMVGAIIVGSINMVWQQQPMRQHAITPENMAGKNIILDQGSEAGLFKLGSTVILLFAKNRIAWNMALGNGSTISYGNLIAQLK